MDKICVNCGEPILPINKEKYDDYRSSYYCERCADSYWDAVSEEEGDREKMD